MLLAGNRPRGMAKNSANIVINLPKAVIQRGMEVMISGPIG
jgi:hypothetical protein